MKTSTLFTFSLLLFTSCFVGCVTKDAYDIRPEGEDDKVPSAVAWQNANDAALEAAMKPQALAAYVRSAAAADALLAEVKSAYQTDPMAATRIAAVTQLVMCPKCDKAPAGRAIWTAALIKAAEASSDSYRTMFLLDQLRWCGKPEQADRILAIGAKAKDPGVKEFAAWTVRELRATR